MRLRSIAWVIVGAFAALNLVACAEPAKPDENPEEKKEEVFQAVPEPDPLMGDWEGENPTDPVAQVIALGKNTYRIQLLRAFDVREKPLLVLEGEKKDGEVAASSEGGRVSLKPNGLSGSIKDGPEFRLTQTMRVSPTYNQHPPSGAVVLFDGSGFEGWQKQNGQSAGWKLVPEEKAMEVVPKAGSIKSTELLGDSLIHVEFRSPFMPEARAQKRGNSGVYVAGVYEIQILDSYGLEGAENECGGVYKAAPPRVNMCAPPLQWQTYDIDYKAPRFDADGKKTANARMTVRHNGVVIHENLELPGVTPGGLSPNEPTGPAPVFFQDHGDLVQFRNIWAVRAE